MYMYLQHISTLPTSCANLSAAIFKYAFAFLDFVKFLLFFICMLDKLCCVIKREQCSA